MSPSECLAAAYSAVFLLAGVALSTKRKGAGRTIGLAAAGLAVAASASWVAGVGGGLLRTWWLLGFLPLAYWMPAPLVGRVHTGLEERLASIDRRLGLGPVMRTAPLELSYLLVYAMVPGGLAAVLHAGGIRADAYWSGVLMAVLPCYGLLPLLPTRPPRALIAAPADPAALRNLNVSFLAIFGNRWNTLPSGHAAGAVAVAVLVWAAGSPFAPVAVVLAAGICIGTISGRYHYVVDTVLGVMLGLLAAGVAIGWN